MNAVTDRFEDAIEPLGVGVGIFLALAALGTISGAPWATNPDVVAVIVQIVGSLAMGALGIGLAYVSWTGRE